MENPATTQPLCAANAVPAATAPIPTLATTVAAATAPLPPPHHHHYPDSVDSSPRSRNADAAAGDPTNSATNTAQLGADPLPPVPGGAKLRLMCSYGGHIVPRPHDKSLCYVGGETRIVVIDRNCTLDELLSRLSKMLLQGRSFTLKYQLPSEDLDSLITVSTEEDLDNMVDEYDRLSATSNPAKPSRIRLFLFPTKLEVAASMGPILNGSNKSDDWFLSALNGAGVLERGFSDPSSVNCLLGLEENVVANNNNSLGNTDLNPKESDGQGVRAEVLGGGGGLGGGKGKLGNQSNQDVHSVPDSPIVETTSSFGSTSSSPSLANLPPIRVHVDDGVSGGGGGGVRVSDQRTGIEEQFSQMGVNLQQKQEEVFVMMSSPPAPQPHQAVSGGVAPTQSGGEFVNVVNRIVSDDERSDHGGYRRPQQLQPVLVPSSLTQQKQIAGDLPSPDSVSSDSSLSNAMSRQKPVTYQDLSGASRMPLNQVVTDTAGRIQLQQVSDPGYLLPNQFDQIQQQSMQQQQQQPSQAQQFVHAAGTHYVHSHPSGGGVPISYYPVYPSQQTHPHHHPVYYIPAGQGQAYNIPLQQPNYGEPGNTAPTSRPQTPTNPTLITSSGYTTSRNVPASNKPETTQPVVYRTTAAGANSQLPQLVQMASHPVQYQHQPQHQGQQQQQHPPQQFVGYSQISHNPQQSIAPTSAANATYAYELSDPAQSQIYFTQPLGPNMGAQYQTMAGPPKVVMADGSTQNPNDNAKQQVRTSQPL